jgi:hypothetical protein
MRAAFHEPIKAVKWVVLTIRVAYQLYTIKGKFW